MDEKKSEAVNGQAKKMTAVQRHKANFETLKLAVKNGDLALLDCKLKSTGESVAVITAMNHDVDSNEYSMVPLAMFFDGNPYDLLYPPNPAGGYFEEEPADGD